MEIEKNTVPAQNQLAAEAQIAFEHRGSGGVRIAFIGNSITRHGPAPALGWYGDWGMAASCRETDYVHRVLDGLWDRGVPVRGCICNASQWERGYDRGFDLSFFAPVRDFAPDILVMRVVENCSLADLKPKVLEEAYEALIEYIKGENTRVILTTSFWKHPGDSTIQAVAEKFGYPCIYLGALGEENGMKAVGRFDHTGVAAHPGDAGMAYIAQAILKEIDRDDRIG